MHGQYNQRKDRQRHDDMFPTALRWKSHHLVCGWSNEHIGKVWRDHNNPDKTAAHFPNGAVAFKLLFTQATEDKVPYLKGAKEWQADIYSAIMIPTNPSLPRTIQTVRLLQIDIAVRDSRADSTTGWVFGTFTYNGNLPGASPFDRMVPVGLMWGNDPKRISTSPDPIPDLKETIINQDAEMPYQHLGWGGRLNGPIDNPISSCISCHSTAQYPAYAPVVPPSSAQPGSPTWMEWFRNIKAAQPNAINLTSKSAPLRAL